MIFLKMLITLIRMYAELSFSETQIKPKKSSVMPYVRNVQFH